MFGSGGLFGAATPAAGTAAATPTFGAPKPAGAAGAAPAAAPLFRGGGGLFGATPTPSAAATTAAPATGLFGAPAATPAFGGGGLFGAAAATPAATPALGGSLFGAAAATPKPALGALGSPLGTTPGFGTPGALGGVGAAPASVPGRWLTAGGQPVKYTTKWEDLAPATQEELRRLEAAIQQHRDESRQLGDLEGRLRTLGGDARGGGGVEAEARELLQGVQALQLVLRADKSQLDTVKESVSKLVQDTEGAIRGHQRALLRRQAMKAAANGKAPPVAAEQLRGPPPLPAPFLVQSAADYQRRLEEAQRLVLDLERALNATMDAQRDAGAPGGLPDVVENVVAVLNRAVLDVEQSHAVLANLKAQFLTAREGRGLRRDPFREADRKEAADKLRKANQAAEAKREQLQQQPAAAVTAATPGLPAAATPGAGTPPPLFGGAAATPAKPAGLNFNTPGAAPAAAAAPGFSTPAAGGLFGAPAATPAFGGFWATPGGFGAPAAGGGGGTGRKSGKKKGR